MHDGLWNHQPSSKYAVEQNPYMMPTASYDLVCPVTFWAFADSQWTTLSRLKFCFVLFFSQLSSNYGSMPGSWYFRAVEMYLRSQNWKQLRQPVSTWLPGTAWEFPVHVDDPLSKTGATSTLTFISSYLKITAEECGLMWVPGGLSSVDTQSWLCPPACLEPLDIFLKSHYRL